jgi:hypothetical protein
MIWSAKDFVASSRESGEGILGLVSSAGAKGQADWVSETSSAMPSYMTR